MKTINDINFAGKKALVRVDFNVPQDENKNVTDNTRIVAAKPTIEKIINDPRFHNLDSKAKFELLNNISEDFKTLPLDKKQSLINKMEVLKMNKVTSSGGT